MSSEILRAEELIKTYRNGQATTRVLQGVSLKVDRGDVIAVVGPSGAGKTTLLYMLGGLARPTSGRVVIGGVDFFALDDTRLSKVRNQRIGFVFQSHNLLPEMSALENVEMPLRIAGRPLAKAEATARQLLREVGLASRMDHRPGELSGGEQQRVSIARALALNPEVILADEPTGNLDSANSEAIFDILVQASRSRGQAVILVTHNEAIAARTDRTIHMADGKIV